jgi:hypothetical protein
MRSDAISGWRGPALALKAQPECFSASGLAAAALLKQALNIVAKLDIDLLFINAPKG